MFKDDQDAKLEWSVKFNNKGILYSQLHFYVVFVWYSIHQDEKTN